MENMGQWIFKVIYFPISAMLGLGCFLIMVHLIKETDWYAPFRWLALINIIAIIADISMRGE